MDRQILIIEDEVLMREVIRDYFEDAGYNVFESGDGLEVIEMVEECDFDLILLDGV